MSNPEKEGQQSGDYPILENESLSIRARKSLKTREIRKNGQLGKDGHFYTPKKGAGAVGFCLATKVFTLCSQRARTSFAAERPTAIGDFFAPTWPFGA